MSHAPPTPTPRLVSPCNNQIEAEAAKMLYDDSKNGRLRNKTNKTCPSFFFFVCFFSEPAMTCYFVEMKQERCVYASLDGERWADRWDSLSRRSAGPIPGSSDNNVWSRPIKPLPYAQGVKPLLGNLTWLKVVLQLMQGDWSPTALARHSRVSNGLTQVDLVQTFMLCIYDTQVCTWLFYYFYLFIFQISLIFFAFFSKMNQFVFIQVGVRIQCTK